MYIYEDLIVIDSLDYTSEELESIKNQISNIKSPQIVIKRNQALCNAFVFEKICSDFSSCDILIYLEDEIYSKEKNNRDVFDEQETAIMKENYQVCQKYNCNLYLSDELYEIGEMHRNKIPFERALEASSKINNWVSQIENAKVGDRPLSPFEKFLYAYSIVTEFKYSESDDLNEARDIARILTGDNIVCVGYAHLLSEICTRIGIPCKPQMLYKGDRKLYRNGENNHENCMIYMHDDLYKVDGFFNADACWDSFKNKNKPATFSHSMIMYSDLQKIFVGENSVILSEDYDEKLSCLRFLQRAGIFEDNLLYMDKENEESAVNVSLLAGKFDAELIETILNSWDDAKDELSLDEEPEDEINDEIEAVENLTDCYKLGAKYLIESFCGDYCTEPVDGDEAFENLFNIIKVCQTKFADEVDDMAFMNNVLGILKEDEFVSNNILSGLARYSDEKVINDVFEKLVESRNNDVTAPTYDAYVQAIKNVYISKGMSKQNAKRATERKLKQSVENSNRYWRKSDLCENVFAVKAIEIFGMGE